MSSSSPTAGAPAPLRSAAWRPNPARWVSVVFDDRYAWLRLCLLALSGIGSLLARQNHPADPYATIDWVYATAALALCPLGIRWPLLTSLAMSLVFALATEFGHGDPMVPQVGATWMVVELALRSPTRHLAIGAGGLAVASFVDHLPASLPAYPYDLIVTMGVPLLIGMNVRASRQIARQAEQRVEIEAQAARVSERAAIARELHDLVAHYVSSMVLRVGVARHVLRDADPRVLEVFDDLHTTGNCALTSLRRLVAVLRNPASSVDGSGYLPIEPGALLDALTETVDSAVKTGLTVDATIDPAVAGLDSVRGLAVLRLTQEGLTNVAKHAGLTARARLRIEMVDDTVHWEITDDGGTRAGRRGRPSDGQVPHPDSGHGMTGMRERVEVLGGELVAGPDGAGWRLRTALPAGARS